MRTVGELIGIAKSVHGDKKPRPNKSEGAGHAGWDFALDQLPPPAAVGAASDPAPGEFVVFVRINKRLPEHFTIGLRYQEPGMSPVVLVRVNGQHGPHPNADGTIVTGPHLHYPSTQELAAQPNARWSRGPTHATGLGPEMNTLPAAWRRFAEVCNIQFTEVTSSFMSEAAGKMDQWELL